MNTVRKHIHQRAQPIPAFRRWLGYVLLLCFLNTIVFPHVPGAIQKWQTCSPDETNTHSLAELILEDCLDIQVLSPVSPEDDAEDVLKTTDDLDLIDHEGMVIDFAQFVEKDTIHNLVNQLPHYTFYSSPTPPPEC